MEELVEACHDRQGDESRVQDRVRLIRRAVFSSDSCSVIEGLFFRCQCACMSHHVTSRPRWFVAVRDTFSKPCAREDLVRANRDRKSTRLNSSHPSISYAVFCL